jgi:hypothetical protein
VCRSRLDGDRHVLLVFHVEVELLDRAFLDLEGLETGSRLRVVVIDLYFA